MNIGDKVRSLRSKEEGIITKILPNNMIEVEIEEGFGIPFHRSEVVLVSPEEARRFSEKTTQFVKFGQPQVLANHTPAEGQVLAYKGLFIGFLPFNDNTLIVHFINNTDLDIPFSLGIERNYTYKGIMAGIVSPRSTMRVHEVALKDFDQWGTWIWQCLHFSTQTHKLKVPLLKRIRFRAKSFFHHQETLPILQKKGYVFQLDEAVEEVPLEQVPLMEVLNPASASIPNLTPNPEPAKPQEPSIGKIDIQKIREEMLEKKTHLPTPNLVPLKAPKYEVDLHIEAITSDFDKMNSQEMLDLQTDTFEKNLDNAIAVGMREIIFIHGVGNGKLKQEIHKRLSQQVQKGIIEYFQEARKEKFGYGATLVRIK